MNENASDDDWTTGVPHIVWSVKVWDPDSLLDRATPDGDRVLWVCDLTDPVVTDAALAAGIGFDSSHDDDEVYEVRYYEWRFLVPQAEHHRRTADDVPVVVEQMRQVLAEMLPPGLRLDQWEVSVDEQMTWANYLEGAVREDYADLLTPLEAVFRERLTSGTPVDWGDAMQVQSWGSLVEGAVMCTARIPAGSAPVYRYPPGGGLVDTGEIKVRALEVGIRATDAMLTHPNWGSVSKFGFTSGALFTPIPRPHGKMLFVVRADGYDGVGPHHPTEWFGYDAAALTEQVIADHQRYWFPVWDSPRP